ncbi:hypothetical protein LSM04_008482 [Trypanosoma melophagium]|uniref:uncharacterized protein n=1 Tax=Trypanosoma melophagium TaxID=715481 RepID=UPI00351A60B9|nr:hypothetical protein LSM04_008482 [Trypanosoma melophagium]
MSGEVNSSNQKSGEGESEENVDLMPWEEFRRRYIMEHNIQHRMLYRANNFGPHGMQTPSPGSFNGINQRNQNAAAQAPQPAVAPPNGMWNLVEPIRNIIPEIPRVFWQVFVATVLLFRSLQLTYFLGVFLAFCAWILLKRILGSVKVERERPDGNRGTTHRTGGTNGTATAPTIHRHQRVSLMRKSLYIVTRCITSFFLSMSPTYSVEQLEAELAADGIIEPHPHQD